MSQLIRLPEFKWVEQPGEIEYHFPDSWRVEINEMSGHNRRTLAPGEIETALKNPASTTPIRELAKGKKRVAILFDDLTRVTRTYEIVPSVLKELDRAGVPKENIRFIAATGLHGVMSHSDFIKKLGKDVVADYAVYNHNPFGNCTCAGTTSTYKTEVHINKEVMDCDFKIAIGQVVPHHLTGFSGGGKIVLPGVASYETIQHHHMMGSKSIAEHPDRPALGMGLYDNNDARRDIDEAARLAGIDFLINVMVNRWGETVAIYGGDMKAAYDAAVEAAKSHYLTPAAREYDIAVANTLSANNVTSIGLRIAFPAIKKSGGHVVLIANYPEGLVPHYLTGRWGIQTWAPQHHRIDIPDHRQSNRCRKVSPSGPERALPEAPSKRELRLTMLFFSSLTPFTTPLNIYVLKSKKATSLYVFACSPLPLPVQPLENVASLPHNKCEGGRKMAKQSCF